MAQRPPSPPRFEAGIVERQSNPTRPSSGFAPEPQRRLRTWQHVLTAAFVIGVIGSIVGWTSKGYDIDVGLIDARVKSEPVQTDYDEREKEPFTISYAGVGYVVKPVAEYELYGLVVSHNNPGGLGDSYHDDKSVDTKDLCVIWGDNAANNDFHNVEFSSGSWTCYAQWYDAGRFRMRNLSNNHLITDSDQIRDTIEDVRVGDQIRIKGMLVNYTDPASWGSFWRKTSTSRDDTGGTACEVVFVEELTIIERGRPWAWTLMDVGLWLAVLALLAKFALMLYPILRTR